MNKKILSALFLSLLSHSAWAEAEFTVLKGDGGALFEVDADGSEVSLFEKDNSVWFVSSDTNPVLLNLDTQVRKDLSIEAVESLKVNGGSGVRLQFAKKPEYKVDWLDVKDSGNLSILSLKEGLVLKGDTQVKVLQANSPLLKDIVTVVPTSNVVQQSGQDYNSGVTAIETKAGFAFQTMAGKPLDSLYQNKQQYLANGKKQLIQMAKNTASSAVLTTKRKPAPVLNDPIAALKPVETANVETEMVAAPKFSLIQLIEAAPQEGDVAPTTKKKVVLTTKNRIPEQAVAEEVFKKDEEAFNRALDTITSAKAKLRNIYTPKIYTSALEQAQEEVVIPKKTAGYKNDRFSTFFGDDVVDADNLEKVYANMSNAEEVPAADSAESAMRFAENSVLGNVDSVEEVRKRASVEDILAMDAEFEVPDLEAVEEIFKVYGDGSLEDYMAYQQQFLKDLSSAESQIKRQKHRLKLAKLYMGYQRPQEVMMTVENMPKVGKTKQIQDTSSRILMGVSNVLMNRPDEAKFYLEKESDKYEDDRKLWLAVAHEMLDEDAEALKLFPDMIHQADGYPVHLIKEIYISYGRVLLRQERLSDLKTLMEELTTKIRSPKLPPEGLMLLAKANVLQRNDALAETLLAQAAASDDKNISFLAQYEFLSFLLNRGDLGAVQAIEHMENLRRLWRGGEVEEQILLKLGRMYIARGEQRKGLERLKYHNVYFTDDTHAEDVTNLMASAFTDLYLDETAPSELDPLALLGLYYDFRELTPLGKEGDKLIEQIAGRLRALGLFDRAIHVLERQLTYRVKDPQVKVKMGLDLAQLYVLNNEYDEALNALNRTEAPDITKELMNKRDFVKAEAFVGLKDFDAAKKTLEKRKDDSSLRLKAKMSWMLDEYASVVDNFQPIYDNPKNLPQVWSEDDKVNFVQLAVAYNNLGRKRDLRSLVKRYEENVKLDADVARVVNFLLKDQDLEMVAYEPAEDEADRMVFWDGVAKSLSAYHEFANYYDEVVRTRESERRDKDIFNRRNRQISAPPRY